MVISAHDIRKLQVIVYYEMLSSLLSLTSLNEWLSGLTAYLSCARVRCSSWIVTRSLRVTLLSMLLLLLAFVSFLTSLKLCVVLSIRF